MPDLAILEFEFGERSGMGENPGQLSWRWQWKAVLD